MTRLIPRDRRGEIKLSGTIRPQVTVSLIDAARPDRSLLRLKVERAG
jgi:hypothetical protein